MDACYQPMLCESAEAIPADAGDWVLEPKFDGWRTVVVLGPASVTLYGGRNGNAYTGKVPYIEDALLGVLPPDTAVDGELIHPNGWGGVQSAMTSGGAHVPSALSPALTLVVFDVLEVNGRDVRSLPWQNRRQLLEMIQWPHHTHLAPVGDASVECHGRMLDLGMEGSVIKRRTSTYRSGQRSRDWLKLKAIASEDCKIVGFEEGKSGRAGEVGAIVVELPSGVQTTASGMTDKVRADMLARPDQYIGKTVEIVHNGVMASGKLRHPRYKRMRTDKDAGCYECGTPGELRPLATDVGERMFCAACAAKRAKPKPAPRTRQPRSGPWMRNYKAMGDAKLQGALSELCFGHGDAYQRCIDRGGNLNQHILVARAEALSRGLSVPSVPAFP